MTYISRRYIPVEMLDDEPALDSMAEGNPYRTTRDAIDPDFPWALIQIEWPSKEAHDARFDSYPEA